MKGHGRRSAVAIVALATATLWLAGGLTASADGPAGNNGTVKIAGEDLSGTEAHVGCTFTIDFYGFDEGDLYADVSLEAVSPTVGGTVLASSVFIGEDPAGGAVDLDASAPIDLSGAFPDPAVDLQGYHVQLTVHADGSQGADVKHKTFWVTCDSGEGEGEGGGEGEGSDPT